ncbi:ABC-F family ATP-binding cassette domain-containing protein [Alteraurantiacibacter palmitatis]|uniref:ABC-F family ATP-binding cassette domain-containing protein n=1 Tax=Alteraurantiacibacter palmitatis TaxID=2054628 RepID=A0ABV7E0L8_9SPHN
MIQFADLTVRLGGHMILDRASAALPPGSRVGLVGRNGAGKSTLMRTLMGEIEPDSGSILVPTNTCVGYLEQDALAGNGSALETVLAADRERARLMRDADTTSDPQVLAEIQERLLAIGGQSAPSRAARILAGLGFDQASQSQPLDSLSGGWRMRVALAGLLFSDPDVLLLDEPSNHLDLEATLWLEDFLRSCRATMLIVSHERDLLNRVADHILHLDHGTVTLYRGNYDSFEKQRAERDIHVAAWRDRQLAERVRLQSFVDRWRVKSHTASQAQSRMKALARMEPIVAQLEDPTLTFDFPDSEHLKSPLIAVDNAAVGYVPGNPVLRRLNLRIDPEDRIALLGRNGNGKTTLARLLAGQLDPVEGTITAPSKMRVGYFTQYQVEELDHDATPLDHMARLLPDAPPKVVRAHLGRFGFSGDKATIRIDLLSGGERARLALALITRDAPHLLILDEPTNHLDVDTREALVQALAAFTGAVIIVSHDRHVLQATADRLVLVEAGTAKPFDGTLDDYTALVLGSGKTERPQVAQSASDRKGRRRAAADLRQRQGELRKRIQQTEKLIARLESRCREIDRTMFVPAAADPPYAGKPMGELLQLRANFAAQIKDAEAQWLLDCEAIESGEAM